MSFQLKRERETKVKERGEKERVREKKLKRTQKHYT
jgi:hypothetical protein